MAADLSYSPGSEVEVNGRLGTISKQLDLDKVLISFRDTGAIEAVPLGSVKAPTGKAQKSRPVAALSKAEHDDASKRLSLIKPLLDVDGKTRSQMAKKIHNEGGPSTSTLYRWVGLYENRRLLSDLAPRRPKKRKSRLSKNLEAIVKDALETILLTQQKMSKQRVIDEVKRKCHRLKLKPPSDKTIRNRITALDEREVMKRRHGEKAAREKYDPIKGEFPNADYPLAVVQIDHTPLDIILVSSHNRKPIGRPYLTLAIDVFSRMVTGFYLSLEAPSAFSVGMCIRHSVLQKEKNLDDLKVKGDWPVWGLMQTVHADNGKDFRSQAVEKACEQYGINLEWRPVGSPQYGGHIERVLKTINDKVHELPGTTFSNVQQKGKYPSEENASYTLDDMTTWLTDFIVNVYHRKAHSTIEMPPINRWRQGILGTPTLKGIGLPTPVPDAQQFKIDFLPSEERTVQRNGIVWDHVWYYNTDVYQLIKRKMARKVTVRRDPRNISHIWLFHPELKTYLEIPLRTIRRPTCNLWELRAATRKAKEECRGMVDEAAIFAAYDRLDALTEKTKKETKKARRRKESKDHHKKSLSHDKATVSLSLPPSVPRLVIAEPSNNHGPDLGTVPMAEMDEDETVFDIPNEIF